MKQAMDQIAMRADSGGHSVTGIATGLIDLDDITGGFHPGQLIIVAARPSMGKTALALNICDHVGSQQLKSRALRQPGNGPHGNRRAPALRPVAGRRP